MARIICYGTKVKYFPIRLSQPFFKAAILDEESAADAEFLPLFLAIISIEKEDTKIKSGAD